MFSPDRRFLFPLDVVVGRGTRTTTMPLPIPRDGTWWSTKPAHTASPAPDSQKHRVVCAPNLPHSHSQLDAQVHNAAGHLIHPHQPRHGRIPRGSALVWVPNNPKPRMLRNPQIHRFGIKQKEEHQ